MVNAVGPAQRNVVVATAKVSKANIGKFQELMDSEGGFLDFEVFYNEEASTYFIVEYWESLKNMKPILIGS